MRITCSLLLLLVGLLTAALLPAPWLIRGQTVSAAIAETVTILTVAACVGALYVRDEM